LRRALTILFAVLLLAMIGVVASDSLFWKRYALSAVYGPTNLPSSFYEPTEIIVGVEGPEPPRVQPQDEHLDAASLKAAAEYAGARDTSALIVGRHGHIVFEQYWDDRRFDAVTDMGDFDPVIAALMLGIARGDRKIGLPSQSASDYIEEFRNDDRRAITIEDLLHMASGLAPPKGDGAGWHSPWSEVSRERFATDIGGHCLSRKLAGSPGEHWAPQTCDVQLLARVVELATRERYASYISERLWKPIGAADAWLARDSEAGTPRADCCLRARRGDWMRIAELLVNDGRFEGEEVVPPGWVWQMLAPSKVNPRFGYQVWIGSATSTEPAPSGGRSSDVARLSEPYAADDTYLLMGVGKTRLWLVPSLRLTILRVGTTSDSDQDWDDARIPNLIIRGASDFVPKAAKSGAVDLSTLVPNH
jgi:hypothetical protein